MSTLTFHDTTQSRHPERGVSFVQPMICGVEDLLRLLVSLLQRGRLAIKLLVTVLREIFDETAYERFLAQHKSSSTAEAYAEFSRECSQRKARCARCC